jgi:hypothetical protein
MQASTTTAPPEALPLPVARRIGGLMALLLGMGIGSGLIMFFSVVAIVFSGGLLGMIGLQALVTFNNLHLTMLDVYLAYPIALWFLGRDMGANLSSQRMSITVASARFSFGLSAVLWAVFLITQLWIGKDTDLALWLFGAVVMALITGLVATFSFGLFIAFIVKNKQGHWVERQLSR